MRVDASKLVADGVRYTKTLDDGRAHEIVAGKSGGVTGYYANDDGHDVDAEAVAFEVVKAIWQLASGHVAAGAPSRLEGVKLVLHVPSNDDPTTVQLGVTRASLSGVEYRSGETEVRTSADVEAIAVARTADKSLAVAAAKAQLRELQVKTGGVVVHATEARVEGLSVSDGSAGTAVKVASIELSRVEVELGSVKLLLARVTVRSLVWKGKQLEVGAIELGDVDVVYQFSKSSEAKAEPEASAGPKASSIPDIPALDQLEGHVNFEAKVEVAVPLLKNRVVNHVIKIPIHRGSLSFGDLEHGLSLIEDALLDFEVEDDQLILELDVIPVVKFDNVTLVSWSLTEPVDRDLAKQKRVRLRRLLQYQLPPSRPKKKPEKPESLEKKGAFRLVGVAFEFIDIALRLDAPVVIPLGGGTIRLASPRKEGVDQLTLRGTIHLSVEEAAHPGHLNLTMAGLDLGVDGVSIGSTKILRGKVEVDAVEPIRADLSDVSPTSLGGRVQAARISDLAIDLGS